MSDKEKKFSWKRFENVTFSGRDIGKRVRRMEKSSLRHAQKFVTARLDRLSLVRRVVVGWIALVLILAGVSTAQWFGFRQAYLTNVPANGGSYSEGVLGPLESLNPIFARSSAERSAARLLFAGLYTYDDTGHIKGDLARSVVISDDQTEYTVSLQPSLKWSDGAPLTAKDIVFTVNLLKNPAVHAELSGWAAIKAELVDATTVKFMLPGAYAPFMHALTFPVLPEHVLADVEPASLHEHDFSQHPVTSGPFALRLLQSAASDGSKKVVHMVANPRYHRGTPKLERFQLYAYNTRDEIEQALSISEIMATPELRFDARSDKIKTMYASESHAINNGMYAILNTSSNLLREKDIRQALSLSVDRDKLIQSLPQSATSLDGPVLDIHTSDLPQAPKQDIKKAQELLDQAGWRVNGTTRAKDGVDLSLRMVALQGAGSTQTATELAKLWQDALNIKVDVQMVDPLDPNQSVLQTVLQPRNFDILIYELVLGGDPDSYAYWHSSQATPEGLNFSNYSSVVVDDALAGARARTDTKYRDERYRVFARRWLTDIPAVALYQPKIDYIHSRNARTVDEQSVLVSAEDRYYNVIYWSVSTASVYKTP